MSTVCHSKFSNGMERYPCDRRSQWSYHPSSSLIKQSSSLRQATIILCFLLIYICSHHTTHGQFIQPGLCDMHCHCPAGEAVVDCNRQDKLRGVPTNIPRGVSKLYVQYGDFPTPSYITRANMTGLEELEHLRIIYCNLQAIESKTFLGMTKLRHLDLSHNALRRLDAYTFFGLQLVNLYLQEQYNWTNVGLQLTEDTFDGLTAAQVNLRGNLLTDIRYNVFSKVNNLHRLVLSDNRITQVDEGFSSHFIGPSYLLDLTANPLECSCKLAWIASLSAQWANNLPGVNITCVYQDPSESPMNQHKRNVVELRRLTADHLCPRSRIQYIEVNVIDLATRVLLDCTAVSIPQWPYSSDTGHGKLLVSSMLPQTPPEVTWQYVEDGQSREIRKLPSEDNQISADTLAASHKTDMFNAVSSTVRLNVSLKPEPRQYKCTTRSQHKETEQVIVTVRGPPHVIKSNLGSSITSEKPIEQDVDHVKDAVFTSDELLSSEPHYLRPQFSLAQLVLAIIGTFLVTLVLLCIGARIWALCNSNKMFRNSSCSSSIKTPDKVVSQPISVQSIQTNNIPNAKFNNLPKTNGFHTGEPEHGRPLLGYLSPAPCYSQPIYSGTDNSLLMSPQFPHAVNPYAHQTLIPSPPPPSHQVSLNSDNLPANFANLVSSHLLQDNGGVMRQMPYRMEASLSPCMSYGTTAQYSMLPPPTPASPHYGTVGNPEYDSPISSTPNLASRHGGGPQNTVTHIGSMYNMNNDPRLAQSPMPPHPHQ